MFNFPKDATYALIESTALGIKLEDQVEALTRQVADKDKEIEALLKRLEYFTRSNQQKEIEAMRKAMESACNSLREISLWDKTTAKDVALAKSALKEARAAIAAMPEGE